MGNTFENLNGKFECSLIQKLCFALVWIITIYSSIIQQKYIKIPNAMLILGAVFVFCFLLSINKTSIRLYELLPKEETLQLIFIIYMLTMGTLFAVWTSAHLSQIFTTIEYFIVMLLTAYTIRKTNSDFVQLILLVIGVLIALILIFDPCIHDNGQYSLSIDSNPNGVGMSMVAGMWALLYLQSKKNIPLLLVSPVIGLLGYGILLTASRKSLIAGVMVIVLWMIFTYLPGLKNEHPLKIIACILLIVIIGSVMLNLFMKQYDGSVLATRMDKLEYEVTEGTRNSFYKYGLEMLEKHPVFGIGFQGFKYYIGMYSHSTFIEVLVSGGIVGAILYFLSYFFSVRKIIRLLSVSKNCIEDKSLYSELAMLLILWAIIIFYCTCIIHPYQYDSFILFAIIFGKTGAIENIVYEL